MGDYLVKGLKLICTDVLEIEFSIPQGHSQNFKFSPGEYISLNVSNDDKVQAVNVTGVLGGSLRCDEPRHVSRRGGGRGPDCENSEQSN